MANRLFIKDNYLVFVQNFELGADAKVYDTPLGGVYRERRATDEYELVKTNAQTRNSLQFPFSGFRIKLIQDDMSTLQDGTGNDFSSSGLDDFLTQNTGGFSRGSGGSGGKTIFAPSESPFATIQDRETWAAANLTELFQSATQETQLTVTNEAVYKWVGEDTPASYVSSWQIVTQLNALQGTLNIGEIPMSSGGNELVASPLKTETVQTLSVDLDSIVVIPKTSRLNLENQKLNLGEGFTLNDDGSIFTFTDNSRAERFLNPFQKINPSSVDDVRAIKSMPAFSYFDGLTLDTETQTLTSTFQWNQTLIFAGFFDVLRFKTASTQLALNGVNLKLYKLDRATGNRLAEVPSFDVDFDLEAGENNKDIEFDNPFFLKANPAVEGAEILQFVFTIPTGTIEIKGETMDRPDPLTSGFIPFLGSNNRNANIQALAFRDELFGKFFNLTEDTTNTFPENELYQGAVIIARNQTGNLNFNYDANVSFRSNTEIAFKHVGEESGNGTITFKSSNPSELLQIELEDGSIVGELVIDHNQYYLLKYNQSSSFTVLHSNISSAVGGGINYVGDTPENLELIVGTGDVTQAKKSTITLEDVAGTLKIPAEHLDVDHPITVRRDMPTEVDAQKLVDNSLNGNSAFWLIANEQLTESNRNDAVINALRAGMLDADGNEIPTTSVDASTIRLRGGTQVRIIEANNYRVVNSPVFEDDIPIPRPPIVISSQTFTIDSANYLNYIDRPILLQNSNTGIVQVIRFGAISTFPIENISFNFVNDRPDNTPDLLVDFLPNASDTIGGNGSVRLSQDETLNMERPLTGNSWLIVNTLRSLDKIVAGANITIMRDPITGTVTISAIGNGGGGGLPPADADIIYYGLSDLNNPADVDISTLTTESDPTNPDVIDAGTSTLGQFLIILVPMANDLVSIFENVLNQEVTSIFTPTENVRTLNDELYKSYVLGALNEDVNESYTINF